MEQFLKLLKLWFEIVTGTLANWGYCNNLWSKIDVQGVFQPQIEI
jgi:hypothetical protein